MRLKSTPGPLVLAALMTSAALGTYHVVSAEVTGPSGSLHVAASEEVRGHVHAIALTIQNVQDALNDGDPSGLTVMSSEGFDDGVSHTHAVTLTEDDLRTLMNTGKVSVESAETLGHKHRFEFLMERGNIVVTCPENRNSPSPSPSMRPSSSPSPSLSPSPVTSPSPGPSGAPSEEPMGGAGGSSPGSGSGGDRPAGNPEVELPRF